MNSRTGRLVANPATSWGVEQGLVTSVRGGKSRADTWFRIRIKV